jgi:aldehyde reductase
MESLQFSDGRKIPIIGFGVWNLPGEQIKDAVKAALEAGYRHFDCAFSYGNEKEVGEALEEYMKSMNLKREDIFVTSKLWNTFHRPELVETACRKSLEALKLSYLDLYLMHSPVSLKPGDDILPMLEDGKTMAFENIPIVDTYKAMEKLVDMGLVKSIGISNFNRRQIENVFKNCRVKPVNLQIEVNASFPNTKLVEYAQSKGLVVTAFSPLASPGAPAQFWTGAVGLLEKPWITKIASAHNKTPAQILLRYLIQRNLAVVPKSANPSRIRENIDIFNFNLTSDEMNTIEVNAPNERRFDFYWVQGHPEYPFSENP